jgi:hypothetical protein
LREQIAGHNLASECFAVDSFTLFRSVLSPTGASHFRLERYPLLDPGIRRAIGVETAVRKKGELP